MPSHNANQNYSYLDAQEVAELLGLSMRTVVTRAKHRPWLLPPRAELRDRELLRWRQDVVLNWLMAVTEDAEHKQREGLVEEANASSTLSE
jgi:predicted DNA-binding transcriptional regulator AlpA